MVAGGGGQEKQGFRMPLRLVLGRQAFLSKVEEDRVRFMVEEAAEVLGRLEQPGER